MIKGYIKRQIDVAVRELSVSVGAIKVDIDGIHVQPGGGVYSEFGNFYSYGIRSDYPGLKDRVKDLEQKVDLLLEHLNLCKTDVPATTVLKKCKEVK